MQRINTTHRALNLFGAGKHGFKDTPPESATEITASFMNAIQEELATVAEALGGALNPADNGQVLLAIKKMIQSRSANYAPDTGSANACVMSLTPALTAYADGLTIRIRVTHANTAAATLDAGGGAVPLVNNAGEALVSGDLVAGSIYEATYIASANKFYLASIASTRVGTGAPVSNSRNRIINGDMQISQVNGANSVTPATSGYPIDQWRVTLSVASALSFQQVTDAPPGFSYALKVSVAAQYAPGATDYFTVETPVEGQDIIDLGFGAAAPSTIAVSIYGKASIPGTYACYIRNSANTRSYVGTITLGDVFARQTVILVADNTGYWAADNTAGLIFGIDLGSGANYNAPIPSAWNAGNYLRTDTTVTLVNQVAGSSLHITGAQLEPVQVGATQGTPFEHVSYAEQERACQRYLPVLGGYSTLAIGGCQNSTTAIILCNFMVPARVPPTGVVVNDIAKFALMDYISVFDPCISVVLGLPGTDRCQTVFTIGRAAFTPGRVVELYGNVSSALMYFTGAQM